MRKLKINIPTFNEDKMMTKIEVVNYLVDQEEVKPGDKVVFVKRGEMYPTIILAKVQCIEGDRMYPCNQYHSKTIGGKPEPKRCDFLSFIHWEPFRIIKAPTTGWKGFIFKHFKEKKIPQIIKTVVDPSYFFNTTTSNTIDKWTEGVYCYEGTR